MPLHTDPNNRLSIVSKATNSNNGISNNSKSGNGEPSSGSTGEKNSKESKKSKSKFGSRLKKLLFIKSKKKSNESQLNLSSN
jgi:hypothetical protein